MKRKLKNVIRIGLLVPLTGVVSLYGEDIVRAGQLAADLVNDSGGLLGKELEVFITDDGSLPGTAVPAAKKIVQEDGCVAIIGNLLSNSRIAVADQVSVPFRIPHLNFSFYEGSIYNKYFFNFSALPNQQIEKMIPFMATRFGMKMYFAGNNYEWPRGSIDAAKRSLERIGGETVGEQYLPIGINEEAIEWILEGVMRSGADVFVPYFAGLDQLSLLNRFYNLGLKKHMAVVMGHFDEVMASHLAPEVREGLFSSNTYFMSVETRENINLLKRLGQCPGVYGIWPNGNGTLTNFGEGTYTCVMAYADAVRRAETTDIETLIPALESVRISVPQGEVIMDADTHHAYVNSYLSRCKSDGSFEIIESFGSVAPEIPARYKTIFTDQNIKEQSLSPRETSIIAQNIAKLHNHQGDIKKILDVADLAIVATDSSGIITATNRATAQMFSYDENELVGMPMRLLVPPHLRQHHDKAVQWFIESGSQEMQMGRKGEKTGYRKDGTFFPLEASIAKFESVGGWVLVATLQDLTESKKSQEDLTRQATHDLLTGLPNRALLYERVNNALYRSKRTEYNVALLFVDLDGFKTVNDSYGHEAGDFLLKEISARMIENVRPGDTVARFAGDEFVILCENVVAPTSVASLADRLISVICDPIQYDSVALGVTASIGIALGHGTTHSAEDLIRFADNAMYAVKEKRRNGWSFFNESLQQAAQQRLNISNGLRLALGRDEFKVVFQPIVTLETEIVSGAEALLRWRSKEGPISPAVFIPIAEMNGAIINIGRWVFEQACRAQRRWQGFFGDRAPYITINVSARQFADEHLVQTFFEIIRKTEADPRKLVLEITETSLMSDVSGSINVLNELRKSGMKIAVDDFGTGYSSLSQLVRLNIDTLKIDKSFVWGFDKNKENEAIVAAITRMAKSLNIRLVAEGIETESHLNGMLALGVQSGQGYFFSKPLAEKDFLEFVEHNTTSTHSIAEDLYFLVYVSQSGDLTDKNEVMHIQSQSQTLNRKNRITGYLVYHEGVFVQYVEGPRGNVDALFKKILHDTRHRNVAIVAQGMLKKRLFVGWSMGYQHLNTHALTKLAGFECDPEVLFTKYKNNPELCLSLFELLAKAT